MSGLWVVLATRHSPQPNESNGKTAAQISAPIKGENRMILSKNFTLAIGATALTLGLSGVAHADLTFTSWGGAYTASQQKAYGTTWEEKTGNKITWENYNGGLGQIRTMVEAGDVRWDIVDLLSDQARTGCDEGLLEEIPASTFILDAKGTPLEEDMSLPLPNNCVAPEILYSYMPFFQEGTYTGEQPDSMKDFFDLEKFPGKRAIHTWPQAIIEMALYADGVAIADIYDVLDTPEGVDRAFAKLDTIKDQIVFWSSGAKPLELVTSGEVAMSLAYNGRIGAAILSENAPFVPIWDGQVLDAQWVSIVKGTKNLDEALEFVAHLSAPAQQAGQAKWINYGPMRKSGLEIIAANEPWYNTGVNIMEHMPNRAEVMPVSVFLNADWWADNVSEISERYTAWMAK